MAAPFSAVPKKRVTLIGFSTGAVNGEAVVKRPALRGRDGELDVMAVSVSHGIVPAHSAS